MKPLGLLLALLCISLPAGAQEIDFHEGALIESAEVQGASAERLSAELRNDIRALADQRLSRERVLELVARIEAERPDVVAAARDVLRPDGRVRVIFLLAAIGDDTGLASNINSRYVVERVEVAGVDENKISQTLRDELQTLVGGRLDPTNAERLSHQLEADMPDYEVTRHISRGTATGRIVVIFTFAPAERRNWIRFTPQRSKVIYHKHQGWSGVFDLATGFGSHLFSVGFVASNSDDLVEKYSGYWLRVENRKVGTRRLGLSLEFSRFTETWRSQTLASLTEAQDVPEAYHRRRSVQPAVTFAFNPHVNVSVGASVSQLDPLLDSAVSRHANAAVAALAYDQRWRPDSGGRHRVLAGYEWRTGTTVLGSDLIYTRQFAQAHYVYQHRHNRVKADLLVGGLSGRAPLFERFSLGDSLTLRGFDKYGIAPIGGNRMWHQSIEYAYRNFAYFVDAGSVWQKGADARVRVSTGVGYHYENAFVTVAVPLNSNDLGVTFMFGFRSAGATLVKR